MRGREMKIKPCVFCGSGNIGTILHGSEAFYLHGVYCCGCGMSGPLELTESKAVKSWNRFQYLINKGEA